jgi:hypothetical protein
MKCIISKLLSSPKLEARLHLIRVVGLCPRACAGRRVVARLSGEVVYRRSIALTSLPPAILTAFRLRKTCTGDKVPAGKG